MSLLTEDNRCELERKVQAGVRLLDTHWTSWRDNINVDKLVMEDCHLCVLGQLYGDFFDGLSDLNLTLDQEIKLGFNIPDSFVDDEMNRCPEAYAYLRKLWIAAIQSPPPTERSDS